MVENWNVYYTHVNDEPAVIAGNFGLRDEAPIESLPWLLRVTLSLKTDDEERFFSKEEEGEIINEIEDALVEALARDLKAVFVGRVTMRGIRDFYFYSPSAYGFDTTVGQTMVPFQYEFDTAEKHDPKWEAFLGFLYPTDWDWEVIKNRQVIENLQSYGDDLSQPRRIHHWLYFAENHKRLAFAVAAKTKGFGVKILEPSERPDARPFGIHVHRIDQPTQPEIDQVCAELVQLSQDYDGDYDGWETQVVKPGEEPTEDAPPED